jgi:hypothetical protein
MRLKNLCVIPAITTNLKELNHRSLCKTWKNFTRNIFQNFFSFNFISYEKMGPRPEVGLSKVGS